MVCGHIHRPEITTINDCIYLNCGDWVESCTALLEHHDGTIELIHYADRAEVPQTASTGQSGPRCLRSSPELC